MCAACATPVRRPCGARAAPAALLKTLAAAIRHRHRTRGRAQSMDAYSYAKNYFVVILQPGDGPSVYDVLGLSESFPAIRPLWIGHRDNGSPVVYRVLELQGKGKTVRLYIPEDTPWAP